MKTIFRSFQLCMWLLIICVIVTSCEKEDNLLSKKKSKIEFSYKYLDVTSQITKEEAVFTAATDWQVLSKSDWIKVSPQEGKKGENLTITLFVTENESIGERIAEIVVKSCSSEDADTLTVRQMGISSAVSIDWEKTSVERFDLTSGEVVLRIDGRIPHFQDGVSSIVIPTDSICYIRRVQHALVNDNIITLHTERGDMTDIFVNQDFTLSTTPASKAFVTRAGKAQTTDDAGIIHPTKIIASMSDGSTEVLYDLYASSKINNSFYPIKGDHLFYKYIYDKSNQTIYEWSYAKLLWDKCRFLANLNGQFYFSFGEYEIIGDKLKIPKGELLNFYYFLEGNAEIDLMLRMNAEEIYVAETKKPIVLLSDVLGAKGFTFYFPVGAANISINVNADICAEAKLEAQSKANLTAGLTAGISLKAGASYVSGTSTLNPILDADASFTLHKPEVTVKGSVQAQATLYPNIRIRFFDFAGPNIKIKPYIATDFEFGTDIGGSGLNTYFGWNSRVYTYTQVETSLALDFAGKKLWESSSLSLPLIKEKDLYRAPDKISLLTDEEKEYKTYVPIPVRVKVTGSSILDREKPAIMGAVVKFEATNSEQLDKGLALTDNNGEAVVNWTPENKNDRLHISIINAEGEPIDEIDFAPNLGENNEVTPGRVIDLGLSVKWASCNLGTNKPEGYGQYFPYSKDMTNMCSSYLVNGLQLPTKEEMEELVDKCKSRWVTYNGIKGMMVTGPNGNTIFLPAAGYYINVVYQSIGNTGTYWSVTVDKEYSIWGAYIMNFNKYSNKLSVGFDLGPGADPGHYNMYRPVRAVMR